MLKLDAPVIVWLELDVNVQAVGSANGRPTVKIKRMSHYRAGNSDTNQLSLPVTASENTGMGEHMNPNHKTITRMDTKQLETSMRQEK